MASQSEQRLILKWLLEQIIRAKKRKEQLEDRLIKINEERNAPIGGPGYQPLPRNEGKNEGAASIVLKLAEIEDRIFAQKEEVDEAIVRVMDILECLPASSVEREICELKYIDMKSGRQIEDQIPMSHSQVSVHFNRALDMLLQDEHIRQICKDNEDAYLDWAVKKEISRLKADRTKNKVGGMVGGMAPENNSRKKSTKKKRR